MALLAALDALAVAAVAIETTGVGSDRDAAPQEGDDKRDWQPAHRGGILARRGKKTAPQPKRGASRLRMHFREPVPLRARSISLE